MTTPAPALPSTQKCPLCGQPNQCAMALGLPAADCWCMSAEIPRHLLAAVPADLRGAACICAACAQGATAQPI